MIGYKKTNYGGNYIIQYTDINRRKNVAIPIFNFICFICRNSDSANIFVNYLQNNMNFKLIYKEWNWYSLASKSNEKIHVWTIKDFEKMRGYRYQAIFIQDDIYNCALAETVSIHALWVNELIPPIKPQMFKLPKETK